KVKFVRPEIWVMACYVWVVTSVAASRRLKRQEIYAQRAFVGSAIGPKGSSCFPICPQTRIVGHCVLDDERLDPLRVRQGHAKTHGTTVILHVKRVAREPKSFGEMIHGFGDVIERVGKFFRVRPVTVSEAGVIGRD